MSTRRPRFRPAAACLALALAVLPAFGQEGTTERVAFLGDSMMQLLAHQGEREMGKRPGIAVVTNFTSLGSGLARLDAFDWMGKFDSVMKEARPTLVIIALGTNDRQPLQVPGGATVRPGEPGWTAEYGRRAGQAMDILVKGGAARIYWLELPDMKDPAIQSDADEINAVVKAEAARRPAVTFFETRRYLSRKPGEFTKFMIDASGRPIECRASDGIHLSRAGADLVVGKMMNALWPKKP